MYGDLTVAHMYFADIPNYYNAVKSSKSTFGENS